MRLFLCLSLRAGTHGTRGTPKKLILEKNDIGWLSRVKDNHR